jgi:uncharacterized protein
MYFALIANDKPNGLSERLANRPDHLKHLESLGEKLILAGPLLDQSGDANGSIMIVEAANLGEAEALFKKDPFVERGVFGDFEIRPWRLVIQHIPRD